MTTTTTEAYKRLINHVDSLRTVQIGKRKGELGVKPSRVELAFWKRAAEDPAFCNLLIVTIHRNQLADERATKTTKHLNRVGWSQRDQAIGQIIAEHIRQSLKDGVKLEDCNSTTEGLEFRHPDGKRWQSYRTIASILAASYGPQFWNASRQKDRKLAAHLLSKLNVIPWKKNETL